MQASGSQVPVLGQVREGWASIASGRRRGKWDTVALLFILPWVVHFFVFTLYPLYIALYGSVATWDILTDEMEYVGFIHYQRLLRDTEFLKAIRHSFVYLLVQVPASIAGGFFVALLLNQAALRGRMFLRGIYFLPVIVPTVVMAIVWQWMYATQSGVINYFLSFVGVEPVKWLTSETLSMPSIAIMKIWNDVGFYAVLFLAGLQGISREVLDAAKVDGVNEWQMSWLIKVPLLNPVVVFSIVMGTLWGLNIFTEPLLMTNGGPRGSSLTTLLYLYHEGFVWSRLGYANAIGVTSTAMILLLTWIERRALERTSY
jgi:ABC-type sugar transport system permease subunit